MNDELIKSIKEFYIKQIKLLDEMTNYSKTQLISIIEREMNENHYLRNEEARLNNIINKARRKLGEYKHYSTPTEEQNKENEDISEEVYQILHENLYEIKN